MTHNEIRTAPDGTRVYSDYHRYRPKPASQRSYAVRKPQDPRAVRFGASWYLPLELVDEAQRSMPLTRPDEQTLEHHAWCRCEVCSRPAAQVLWARRQRREKIFSG